MSIATYSKYDTYKQMINSLPYPFKDEDLISERFLLEKDVKKKLEIYYAPFEYVNKEAKVLIVGITPGLHQMKRSYSTVLSVREQGLTDEETLHEVKKNSSFEGSMRKNLIQMLDALGLNSYLGLSSTIELFGPASYLVQTTSVLPYPVFYNGKNYNGSTPNILKTELLKKQIDTYTAKEIGKLPDPLIIPLGVNVSTVFDYLVSQQIVKKESIVKGFPHPSGGNGHRHRQFAENKELMKMQLKEYFSCQHGL
ncbi:hypothetical protein ACFYKX_01795 [Cytobacillus sp. FJAT-54145]|uniref:Uracil DNA glycosylase superfamily protein n=1 Tax=Cytobacillus spartinae TaxID=3299023 RepID=A0ABW6K8T7_9BACI